MIIAHPEPINPAVHLVDHAVPLLFGLLLLLIVLFGTGVVIGKLLSRRSREVDHES